MTRPPAFSLLAAMLLVAPQSCGGGATDDAPPGPDVGDAIDAADAAVPTDATEVIPPGDPALRMREAGWLSGDLHMHSNYEGGDDPVGVVVALAEYLSDPVFLAFHPEYVGNPIDFIALTDHRQVEQNSDPAFRSDRVILIPGEEFGGPGHAGLWGIQTVVKHDPDGDGTTLDDYTAAIDSAHGQGAVYGMNHPCLPKIPFPWDVRTHDALEVWNTRWGLQGTPYDPADLAAWEAERGPASAAFRRAVKVQDEGGSGQALRLYEAELASGVHVALVGGSDRHILFPVGFPSTWVLAPSRDVAGVLDGIRRRHTFVTRTPVSATVEMTVEVAGASFLQGDEVPVPAGGAEARVTVRVGRANGGRVRVVRGEQAPSDEALASARLGEVAFEADIDSTDFTASVVLTVRPGDWFYPVVHERLVPDGLDPAIARLIPGKIELLSQYSEDNYAPIVQALIDHIDPDVVLSPDRCDPTRWVATDAQCIPADQNGVATFFFPDWIERLLNVLTEGGRPTEWVMGAVGSAVLCVPADG